MNKREVSLSTIALVAGTRMALGAGIGLLLANRLSPQQRRATGLALLAFGALTTIPLVATVFGGNEPSSISDQRLQPNTISPYIASGHTGGRS
jgi:hypothetical protein